MKNYIKQILFFMPLITISLLAVDIKDIDIGDSYYYTSADIQKAYDDFTGTDKKKDIQIVKNVLESIEKITIIRINKKSNTIKVKLSDGTPKIIKISEISGRDEIESFKTLLNEILTKTRNSNYCCCRMNRITAYMLGTPMNLTGLKKKDLSSFDFIDIDINDNGAMWISMEKCNNGWKDIDEDWASGIVYGSGTCQGYGLSSGSCN